MSELFREREIAEIRRQEYKRGWLDGRAELKTSLARPEALSAEQFVAWMRDAAPITFKTYWDQFKEKS